MKKALAHVPAPRPTRASFTLPARLGGGLALLALVGGLGLFASRPAHTAGGPVPVTVANVPLPVVTTSGTPVEGYITVSDNSIQSFDNLIYTVPAGKQLAVDSATVIPFGHSPTIGYTAVIVHEDSLGNFLSLSAVNGGPGVGAFGATTQVVHIHAKPGDKLVANVFVTGNGPVAAYVSFSGSLTDAP